MKNAAVQLVAPLQEIILWRKSTTDLLAGTGRVAEARTVAQKNVVRFGSKDQPQLIETYCY